MCEWEATRRRRNWSITTVHYVNLSSDRAAYDSTLSTSTSSSCPNADPTAWQCIGTSFFDSYGAFPAGTQYSHNFNLATWNSTGWATLKATVPLACKALRGQLSVWEVGNEPDLYLGSRRPSTYSASDYVTEWENQTSHFESYLLAACPDLASMPRYMIPSPVIAGSKLNVADIFKDLGSKLTANVSQVSVHNYMAGATQAGVTLQKTLMNHTAVKQSIGKHVSYAATAAAADGGNPDYIIGEHNSLYGGGAAGLSDVFGAALWAMDFSLYAASTGVIKRVHFHQSVGSPYAAWWPNSPQQTKPPYYGKMAASTFLAGSNAPGFIVTPFGFGSTSSADLDVGYTVKVNGVVTRYAVLNLREYTGSGTRGSRKHNIAVDYGSTWVVKRLTAANAHSTSGVTFNGYAYEYATQGKPARVSSLPSDEVVKAVNGQVPVTVADSEAIVLIKQ